MRWVAREVEMVLQGRHDPGPPDDKEEHLDPEVARAYLARLRSALRDP